MRYIFLIVLGVVAAVENDSQTLQEFAIGNNQFSANVYQKLLNSNSGNFLVCPLSTETIFALVHSGAGGKTAQEIAAVLHLPEDEAKIQNSFKDLHSFVKESTFELSSANKIYLKNGYKIKDQFKAIAQNVFNSDIQNIEFRKQTEAAAEINKWVENQTKSQVKDVIKPNDFQEDTRSILINTMYFHATWRSPFTKEFTTKQPFYLNQKDHAEVDMMIQRSTLKYFESEDLKAKFLEIPYRGSNASMTFVLPNDNEGLSALEERIKDVFNAPSYTNRIVDVKIPKFKFETQVDFKEILQSLGIQEAFGDYADFREIVDGERLKIDKVVQKTVIEIDEVGTTAAAATVIRLPQLGIAAYDVAQFIADHPFIFYIKIKDIIVFAGRYVSPNQ